MFIRKLTIRNFRLFSNEQDFVVNDLNIPDDLNEGSGLTLFVGENGCGKTSLLDAFALPLLLYKTEAISLSDFFNPREKISINIYSDNTFDFDGTMPKTKYKGKGFSFKAGVRQKVGNGYLSSIIVTDQQYIRADGETKPEDSKPDLRVAVNNPWKGPRFSENDILFLDRNRTYQTRLGTYNPTKFDRLMEDFDYQYIKQESNPIDCDGLLGDAKVGIQNQFIKSAIDKFQEISGKTLSLSLIDSWQPFKNGFLGVVKENKQIISLEDLGSGFEMIFSLIYSFYLSQQSKKQLIVLIDEPELHLHPKLQECFVKLILEFSRSSQIIITTHSPLFVKQALYNSNIKVNVLRIEGGTPAIAPITEMVLPYISSNEINYVAFTLPTEEYHNELFEELKDIHGSALNIKDFDINFFQRIKGETPNYPYNSIPNQVSIHSFLRTQIHHRGSVGSADIAQIESSITKMRGYF